ncbi:hypothetical protein [Microbacterium capsulatum]|uniref:Integral membrane protein n=1 Tax=Microbacterium capsulatum TaxID=3041921 RepID=A0ABU0XIA6_9MICO|nr:hypothetical protein [Microbacterium sp. ASV81]MDQ4214871.1 hypothetical protein [Microbacterium sp. ASV81]
MATASPSPADAGDRVRSRQRTEDRWFRELGLPAFVPLHRWFTDLPRRVAPLVAAVTVLDLVFGDGIGRDIDVSLDVTPGEEWIVFLVIVLLLAAVIGIAWTAHLLVRLLLRRLSARAGTVVALAVIAGSAVLIVLTGYLLNPAAGAAPVIGAVVVVVLCALVTGMGGGALVSWATRLAVRNAAAVGHMASIALPVILMVVVFSLFSAAIWQVTAGLRGGAIALVAAVVAVLALLVVLRVCASEIDETRRVHTDAERAELLFGTPAEHRGSGAVAPQRLRWPERLNLLLVMAIAHLMQAVLFVALLWTLLMLIGSIAVPVEVIEQWTSPGGAANPRHIDRLVIAGATLPVTVNLVKTTALLSIISSLPFVFAAVSEPRYRERFFDPIMADMRRAIIVRDVLMAE